MNGCGGDRTWSATKGVYHGREIEREFLVDTAALPPLTGGVDMEQGLSPPKISPPCGCGWPDTGLAHSQGGEHGATRSEFEYPIPVADARQMIAEFCGGKVISKPNLRRMTYSDHLWEIDVFSGDNAGLILAEVELAEEGEAPRLPPWAGLEVTEDSRYFNANLYDHPYSEWGG